MSKERKPAALAPSIGELKRVSAFVFVCVHGTYLPR
jgi:hypothetical protein